MWKEFRGFIASDNVITLAVGLVMGSAFTAIVSSLVEDIFMPLIVAVTGQADVSEIVLNVGNTTLGIGNFIQMIINFVLIALLLFVVLKGLEKAQKKKIISPDKEPAGPSNEEVLLAEILSELKRK